jgi:hypothetical protein
LDRDTTGVILIAKDNQVHQKISSQFERREVKKEYRAIVRGVPELASDYIRTFVCAHPRVREKMMVCPEGGNAREAVTFYKHRRNFRRLRIDRTCIRIPGALINCDSHAAYRLSDRCRSHVHRSVLADKIRGHEGCVRFTQPADRGPFRSTGFLETDSDV